MDTSDWRSYLQLDSRQRIVNKIMDTLKRHLPVSGQEGLNELEKFAARFEEYIFAAATSQTDYLRQIALEMLTVESKSQTTLSNASLASTALTGQQSEGDWQEEVYQKIKMMKETYLPEANDMYQQIVAKLQQHESLPQAPKSEQIEKLKVFKGMLERIMLFLNVTKNDVRPNYREKLSSYEKQIVNFFNTNRPRKPVPSLQPGQLPLSHTQSSQQQQPQLQVSHENQMNLQFQSMNLQGSMVPTLYITLNPHS